jgi:tape measure domain-containing protein
MPVYNIEVVIDPAQGVANVRKIKGALDDTGTAADRVGQLVKRALAFTGGALLVRQLTGIVDTYTNLQNRLRGVTQNTSQLAVVTSELFKIANSTRSAYESTAELYARVGLAVKEMGRSQEETLQFTKSLNQAVVLSGASASEAQAGIIQLSQGLASGALRGDELRSVLEQLPAVADVIAKSMGITRGELRNMGAEGKITADIVFDAFAKAREELDQRFAKTVPTIGQAFTVLRNSITQAVGGIDQMLGSSATLARVILTLAENMDILIRAAAALGATIVTVLVARGINSAIQATRALTLVIAANPIGAIAVGITAAVAALVAFSDQIHIGADGVTTLRDYGVAAFQLIRQYAGPVIQLIGEKLNQAIAWATTSVASFGLSWVDVLNAVKTVINSIIGYYYGLFRAAQVVFGKVREVVLRALGSEVAQEIVDSFKAALDWVVDKFRQFADFALQVLGKVGVAIGEIGEVAGITIPTPTIPQGIRDFGSDVKSAFLEGFNRDFVGDFTKMVDPAFTALQDRAKQVAAERLRNEAAREAEQSAARQQLAVAGPTRPKGVEADLQKLVAELRKEGDALRMTNSEREIAESLIKAEKALKRELVGGERELVETQLRANQALQAQADILDQIRGPAEEYRNTQAALNGLLAEGAISAAQYSQALSQTQLAQGLQGVRAELPGTEGEAGLQALQDQQNARTEILRQAMEARLITEGEYLELSRQANQEYNQQVLQYETDRFRTQLSQGQSIFNSLGQITRQFAGEQSGVYQVMFRASKAFAIADSTVKIIQGIAAAAANPWPANLAAMASVAAATAGLVGQISGTSMQGFQNGGSFRVGGAGGPDSQMVAFRATPNETVSVKTPGQERQAQAEPARQESQPINVVNVTDPNLLEDYMNTPAGERLIVNTIQRNGSQISRFFQRG